jgi:hypothetical protein
VEKVKCESKRKDLRNWEKLLGRRKANRHQGGEWAEIAQKGCQKEEKNFAG